MTVVVALEATLIAIHLVIKVPLAIGLFTVIVVRKRVASACILLVTIAIEENATVIVIFIPLISQAHALLSIEASILNFAVPPIGSIIRWLCTWPHNELVLFVLGMEAQARAIIMIVLIH